MSRGRDALLVPDDVAIIEKDIADTAPPSEPVVREERAEVCDRGDRADDCDGAEAAAVEELFERRHAPRQCVEARGLIRGSAPDNFGIAQSDHDKNDQKDSTEGIAE